MNRIPARRRIICGAVLALVAALAPTLADTAAQASSISPGTTRYAVDRPACSTATLIRCFAVRRVDVPKGTPGAKAYTVPSAVTTGPAGGYTPADLASAYGYNPDAARSTQTVAIIDWYDAPHAASDLATFDAHYGLAAETSTSFRKVNQTGLTSPLPDGTSTNAKQSSVEIDLDVQSVRAVCHSCQILLVEADAPEDSDLAIAENTAVTMGATEISNSWGASEQYPPTADLVTAFNHPGVVITASTGDDGWYGWDYVNYTNGVTDGAPSYPATDPHVVSVGGTTLRLTSAGTRADETVWNSNGPADTSTAANGASGGGCSIEFTAPAWQSAYPGYTAAGCAGKRLDTDVSAVADPATGLDIIDNDASYKPGWMTIGGTSLASPVVAAMYALGGGSGGVSYPAATLYENRTHRASSLFDVVTGGNSFCGGLSTSDCSAYIHANYGGSYNPNILGAGVIDCSYPASGDSSVAPPTSPQCNATAGYDGASGVGAPTGSGVFTVNTPTVTLARTATSKTATSFSTQVTEPIAGIKPVSYLWSLGDGHTATTAAIRHTYAKAGTYTATVTVTDSVRQHRTATSRFTLGRAASVTTHGPTSVHRSKSGSFSAHATTSNTGARITRVTWSWGDKKSTVATSAKHAWTHTGTYTVKVTVLDSTGVTTAVTRRVKVVA